MTIMFALLSFSHSLTQESKQTQKVSSKEDFEEFLPAREIVKFSVIVLDEKKRLGRVCKLKI
jgi:hypothetical protein